MKKARIIIISLILSITSLLLYMMRSEDLLRIASRFFDIVILLILLFECASGIKNANYPGQFFWRNIGFIVFLAVYFLSIIFLLILDFASTQLPYINMLILSARSFYLVYRIFKKVDSLEAAFFKLKDRPAQSIIVTFLSIIILGTILLMLPFATTAKGSLSFIDALFTSTSAVCVTGLIVVDTATAFTLAGKIIILILIQTGALGIMMVAYFSMFFFGGRIRFEEKQRLLLVIGDSDMATIIESLKKIIFLTFAIEGAGAVLLFIEFTYKFGLSSKSIFSAVFHSISAFCNAGFSIYSNSLENFATSPAVIFTISSLIILGGLSFSVIFNIAGLLKRKNKIKKLALNTKVVIVWTALLLTSGFIFFYAVEHVNTLKNYSTPAQYLAAFFQSVTLRTAGFNSVPFTFLRSGTIIIMCLFMFIGAASGSTAGGIKINTAAVIFAYLKSLVMGSSKINLYRHQLSKREILKAFTILQYGILAVFLGVTALSLSHKEALEDIIFEAVSAFGTVGLSTGLTSRLNSFGKIIVIMLMFNGRLGPLTILTSLNVRKNQDETEYPEGQVLIG